MAKKDDHRFNRGSQSGQETATDEASPDPAKMGEGYDMNTGEVSTPPVATVSAASNGAAPEPEAPPQMEQVHLPKKIVAKDIVGRAGLKCTKKAIIDPKDPSKVEWEISPPRMIYTIFGTANGTRSGESTFGPWTSFTGEFEAVRSSDHARFKSTEAILQEPAQGLLFDALARIKKADASGSVQFAFDVGVRTSQKWVDTDEGTSYEYTIASRINFSKHDPLASLRAAIMPGLAPPTGPAKLEGPAKTE